MIVAAVLIWALSCQLLRLRHICVGLKNWWVSSKKKPFRTKELGRHISKNFLLRFLSSGYSVKHESSPAEGIFLLELGLPHKSS